jgi:positive regulator of sigma E activity
MGEATIDEQHNRCSQFIVCAVLLVVFIIAAIILPDILPSVVSPGKVNACENILGVALGLMIILTYDRFMYCRGK